MKNQTKIIVIVVVIIAIYFAWQRSKGIITYEDSNKNKSIPGQTANSILKRGSKGEYVTKLQKLINQANVKLRSPKIKVDGSFGSQTATALALLVGKQQISYNQALNIYNRQFT